MPARPALRPRLRALARNLGAGLSRPEWLAFLPALMLAAFWTGGEAALLVAALGLPALLALVGRPGADGSDPDDTGDAPDPATGLPTRAAVEAALNRQMGRSGDGAGAPACVVLALANGDALARHLGHGAFAALLSRTARNLSAVLRPGDVVARLDMPGVIKSLNVSNAAAVTLHTLTRKLAQGSAA